MPPGKVTGNETRFNGVPYNKLQRIKKRLFYFLPE